MSTFVKSEMAEDISDLNGISRLSNIIEAGGGTRVIHVEESVMFLYRFLVRGFYCPDLGSSVPENAAQRRRTAGE